MPKETVHGVGSLCLRRLPWLWLWGVGTEGGLAGAQVTQSLPDIAFLNCRPSVIAAAIVYAERRSRGIIPFWPSMLSKLSGYQACC